MKKTLIPGMFSSVSDAELVTEFLNATDFEDNLDSTDTTSDVKEKKDTNVFPDWWHDLPLHLKWGGFFYSQFLKLNVASAKKSA